MASTQKSRDAKGIELRINETGDILRRALQTVLNELPVRSAGPQALANQINVDKVFASRLLKAMRAPDAMSLMHRIPGPEPLRRFLRAASRRGIDRPVAEAAERAVDQFASLIRDELGDRAALSAILSAWVPEARRELELRNKQAAFKAISQLKGVWAEGILATAILSPSADAGRLDLVWISGLIGLRRLHPRASVKLATRRMVRNDDGRHPQTLDGRRSEGMQNALLEEFSSSPPPALEVHRVGEVVHYTWAACGFGPASATDFVVAEVNRSEMRRFIGAHEKRKGFAFAEVSVPAKALQFDTIVHRDVYPGAHPTLRIYDTALEGVADINDPARDIDLLATTETIESLGEGVERIGSSTVPRYGDLIAHVCGRLHWDRSEFRAYRCQIDYPLYGAQVAMCFDPPREP
ncbi:MAG: hypothetical protein D6744_01960 [Planctomycetota bacterium]|nr:MAG: hypothetical protein D6744_01960 [Planctomycetota bacterium]